MLVVQEFFGNHVHSKGVRFLYDGTAFFRLFGVCGQGAFHRPVVTQRVFCHDKGVTGAPFAARVVHHTDPFVLFLQDLPHQEITPHWEGSDQTRSHLAVYCLKDAWLPSRLISKLLVDVQYIQMANVTRVPVNFLVSKGQGVKVQAQVRLNFSFMTMAVLFAHPFFFSARSCTPPRLLPTLPTFCPTYPFEAPAK